MGGEIITLWGDFQLGARLLTFGGILLTFGGVIIINISRSPFPMKSWPKRPPKLAAVRSSLLQKNEPWSIGWTHFRSEI